MLYNLLFCLDYLKENFKAIEVLNIVLEINPYNEIAWLESGKQYLSLNQKEDALSAFDFAIISEDTFVGATWKKPNCWKAWDVLIKPLKTMKLPLD